MAEFNRDEAQRFQDSILLRVREMERVLDREVLEYYRNDRVDNSEDFYENLRGLHNYLKRAYDTLDRLMNDIEWHRNR
jgi:hypothetical protein